MTAYDAIYLTETEHSLLDHSDVPGSGQSGASVSDSRLSLYGETVDTGYVVMEVQEQAGTDLTLAVDGRSVTVNVEGVYAITYSCDGDEGSHCKPYGAGWEFDWEVNNNTFVGSSGTSTGTMVHRFGVGDSFGLQVAGGVTGATAGAMNITRLA